MPLTLRFGERGLRKQWALDGTDTTPFLNPPVGLPPVPGTLAFGPFTEPFGTPPHGVDYDFDAGTARDVFGIRAGRGSLDNAQAISTDAEAITLVGFKHADVDVGRGGSADSAVTLVGAKQGNVATGAGDDAVEIAMLRVGGPAEAAFRISTGAGDDSVTLRGLDAADVAGDPTFARLVARFGDDLPSGEGQESYVDLGGGDDVFTGHTSADLVLGGAGDDSLVGGGGNDRLEGGDSSPPPPPPGDETVSETGTLAAGGTITATLTTPGASAAGPITATLRITQNTPQDNVNVAYVIDQSGSMGSSFSGQIVADQNGNGRANELMDAAIAGYRALNQAIIDAGFGDAIVSVIPFGDSNPQPNILYQGRADADTDADGLTDVFEALGTLQAFGGTPFEEGLQGAVNFFNGTVTPTNADNLVYFLSDGFPFGTGYTAQSATLRASPISADITAVGLGNSASLTDLDRVDDGFVNGSAERITTIAQVTQFFTRSQVDPAEIDRVEFLVNGTVVESLAGGDLNSDPFGLSAEVDLDTLIDNQDDTVVARVVTIDGDIVEVEIVVDEIPPGNGDTLEGGAGDDTLVGGTGVDVFVFPDASFGTDVIADFTRADGDVISLVGLGLVFADLGFTTIDADTVLVDVGGLGTIEVSGTAALIAADFAFA